MQLDPGGSALQEQADRMPAGRTRMDIERQVQLPGQIDERPEDFALPFPVLFLLDRPVVQTDLADGDQLAPMLPDEAMHGFGLFKVQDGGI